MDMWICVLLVMVWGEAFRASCQKWREHFPPDYGRNVTPDLIHAALADLRVIRNRALCALLVVHIIGILGGI
jgi:hypothetical protein